MKPQDTPTDAKASSGPTTGRTRRKYLRDTAGVAGAVVGSTLALAGASGTSSAAHPENTPDHVDDPVFDESILERWKPRLITTDLDVEPTAIHGFRVDSSQEQTAALCYWVEYPVQIGPSQEGWTSHIGDHEPIYAFVRYPDTTDEYLDSVTYSGYHWLAAESSNPPQEGEDGDGRPRAYVAPKYHHYNLNMARDETRVATDYPLKDLTGSLPSWLADDAFHDALAADWKGRGSPAYNPWIMDAKASWWRKEGLSNNEEAIRRAWLLFGVRGAERSELSSGISNWLASTGGHV